MCYIVEMELYVGDKFILPDAIITIVVITDSYITYNYTENGINYTKNKIDALYFVSTWKKFLCVENRKKILFKKELDKL